MNVEVDIEMSKHVYIYIYRHVDLMKSYYSVFNSGLFSDGHLKTVNGLYWYYPPTYVVLYHFLVTKIQKSKQTVRDVNQNKLYKESSKTKGSLDLLEKVYLYMHDTCI